MESCSQAPAGPEQAPLPCAGEELEVKANLATPAHQYVPWILVDGVPLGESSEQCLPPWAPAQCVAFLCLALSQLQMTAARHIVNKVLQSGNYRKDPRQRASNATIFRRPALQSDVMVLGHFAWH